MTEIEDEDTITMMDVIEREDKLEEEASAVLGNSDAKNCTYPRGYIARQALYSCATCFTDSGQEAAICLACSLECHDNHEVYELYTKRNYRCDCGNERFKSDFECKFVDKQSKKAPLNENNTYNHNFSGRYCSCDHRYPPDENDESPESNDEMWQCIVCEDWYHTKHLNASELPSKFEEMACGQCVDKLDFIRYYKLIEQIDVSKRRTFKNDDTGSQTGDEIEIVGPFSMLDSRPTSCVSKQVEVKQVEDREDEPEVSSTVEAPESDTNDSQAENKDPVDKILVKQAQKQQEDPQNQQQESQQEHQQHEEAEPDKKDDQKVPASDCILDLLNEAEKKADAKLEGPIFWSDCDWRNELCRCQKCMAMYDSKKCLFLIDEKDTVQYYEAQGKALAKDSPTPLERGMSALNRMNRAAVAEAMNGYQELKADLSVYLRKFADNNKVVREEDIHEFFEQLRSKKRFKLDDI